MSDISKLHQMLDWKLLAGFHEFPGSNGGTCINEAAIVAAGFEYKKVSKPTDLPECFCRVLGEHLISLNDMLDDKNRQKLIKFIPMLPGSRDTVLISAIRNTKLNQEYQKIFLENVLYNADTYHVLKPVYPSFISVYEPTYDVEYITIKLLKYAYIGTKHTDRYYIRSDANWRFMLKSLYMRQYIPNNFNASEKHFNISLDELADRLIHVMDEAFKIGKQADPLDINIVRERMNEMKRKQDCLST